MIRLAKPWIGEDERRASELKWILRHRKKNVLHQKEAPVVEQVADNSLAREPVLFPGMELAGELGVLASGFEGLVGDFPGSGAGLDARLA